MMLRCLGWIAALSALLTGAIGCRPQRVGDAVRDLSGEAYVRRFETPHHQVEARYLPRSLRRLQEAGLPDSTRLTRDLEDSLRVLDGGNSLVFAIRVAPRDERPRPDFANDLLYGRTNGYPDPVRAHRAFAFGMGERVWLEADGVRIPAAHCALENTFGISPARTFLVVFPEFRDVAGKRKNIELVLDDVVPGMARRKITWKLPVGNYDDAI